MSCRRSLRKRNCSLIEDETSQSVPVEAKTSIQSSKIVKEKKPKKLAQQQKDSLEQVPLEVTTSDGKKGKKQDKKITSVIEKSHIYSIPVMPDDTMHLNMVEKLESGVNWLNSLEEISQLFFQVHNDIVDIPENNCSISQSEIDKRRNEITKDWKNIKITVDIKNVEVEEEVEESEKKSKEIKEVEKSKAAEKNNEKGGEIKENKEPNLRRTRAHKLVKYT